MSSPQWHHAPYHLFKEEGTYMVTSSTYNHERIFKEPNELTLLQTLMFDLADKYNWHLVAWAIFSNHYHFIAVSPENPESLRTFITHFHAASAKKINELHNCIGRNVWYQYRDTYISFHRSYLARLNYVQNNPVKHKLVSHAADYQWCSARWFQDNAPKSYVKMVSRFKTDTLQIDDDYCSV